MLERKELFISYYDLNLYKFLRLIKFYYYLSVQIPTKFKQTFNRDKTTNISSVHIGYYIFLLSYHSNIQEYSTVEYIYCVLFAVTYKTNKIFTIID